MMSIKSGQSFRRKNSMFSLKSRQQIEFEKDAVVSAVNQVRRAKSIKLSVSSFEETSLSSFSSAEIFDDQKEVLKRRQTIKVATNVNHRHHSESESVKSGERASEVAKYEAEITMKERGWEKVRKRLTIAPSSTFYQVWKLVGITLALSSSFEYAYYAAYLHRLSPEEVQ
jgi:hypothetical protein